MLNRRSFALSIVLFIICTSLLAAQEFRATISGTVSDPAAARIPGAAVEAKNLETNAVVNTVTNDSGSYVLPFLPTGKYTISVSLTGFKTAVRENVELRVGDRMQLDFQLEIGGISEQVMVSGEAPLLETASASKGSVIDSAKVQDLPLLGRNPFMLAAIASGVQYSPTLASRSNRPFDNGGMDSYSINGGRTTTNEFSLDGVPNTNTESGSPSNLSFVPSPDATEEFKVQTNTYDAQYGRSGGGIINVSLKSGTNRVRGAVYHYFRNDVLNANSFESNLAGAKKSAFRWNQPGVQIDGPVYIPKIYDGRNKTFFMYSWEKILSSIPYPLTYTVPTLVQRTGDFSQTVQSNGNPVTIYDPLTTVPVGSGYARTAFPGNKIPANRIDPVGLKLVDYFAKPNVAGTIAGANNMVTSPNPRTDEYDQHVIRIDQVINDKHKFFSRYVRGNRHEVNSDAGFPHVSSPWYTHWRINQGINFDLTSSFSPTMVLVSRVGWIRHQFAIDRYGKDFDPTQLGFPSSLASQMPYKWFPQISLTDYSTIGTTGSQFTYSDTYSLSETLNKVWREHSLKFGGEFRIMKNNWQNPTSSFGNFSFNKGYTQKDPLRGDAASGNAFASLMLGYPASGSLPWNVAPAYQNTYFVMFMQDDWRITRKLTVNLGLRWDYESPQTERFNQMNAGFDYTSTNPFKVPGMTLKGGLLFLDNNKRLPFDSDLNNFQPRIGIAYKIGSNMVLRGGYGLMYLPTFDHGQNNGFSTSTTYVSSVDGGITPSGSLKNPYPAGLDKPVGSTQGLATFVGRGFTFGEPTRQIPYVHQFSFGLQYMLPWRMVIEATYIGSRNRSLQVSQSINETPVESYLQGSSVMNKLVANPFKGLLPGTSYNGDTIVQSQLLRPYPQFAGITRAFNSVGKSWYDSLQMQVEKRLSYGLHLLLSYTLSKSTEAVGYLNNSQYDKGVLAKVLTNNDQPQRFILSGSYDLPFLKNASGFLSVFGGWKINWIATLQSGLPVGTPGGAYSSGISAKIPDDQRTLDHWFNTCTLNTAGNRQNCASTSEPVAFIQQPAFTLRTLSSRFPDVRTLRRPQYDFSIFKSFRIWETVNLQFRAEAFNLTNTVWFGGPNTTLGGSAFGVVTKSQANDPRNVQLALRLVF